MFKCAPLRLRALRDRINIRGRSELSFEEKVRCIVEVISTFTFRPRDLSYVRPYMEKLKIRHPDLTEGQKVLLAELVDRYTKRALWIKERSEKKKRGQPVMRREEKPVTPTPAELARLWQGESDGDNATRAQAN